MSLLDILNTDDLGPIVEALSGGTMTYSNIVEPVYAAKVLLDYWDEKYCIPEPGDDNGPPSDDDFAQGAFADFVEMFKSRMWANTTQTPCEMQVLGYDCSEVENTVPDEWHTGWSEIYRGGEWSLESMLSRNGALYRVLVYDEGFGLAFWFCFVHSAEGEL